jgi:hypothetical protein
MDYNKLVRDIIKAAKEDPAIQVNELNSSAKKVNFVTTLKLEVRVSIDPDELYDEVPRNSTKLVMLQINDC